MKKLLLSILFVLIQLTIFAQQRVYCYVVCPIIEHFGDKPTTVCCVDIGQRGGTWSVFDSAVRDEQMAISEYNSPMEVLNMLTGLGWDLVGDIYKGKLKSNELSSWRDSKSGVAGTLLAGSPLFNTIEWAMYKELKEGETQEQALKLFSDAQQKIENK